MIDTHFGEHLTIDGYGGDPSLLNDRALVESSLAALCNLLGMHALLGPHVIEAPDNLLKDPGGWSGFLIISESHLSIHTFPRRRFLSADVYSCQNGIDEFTVRKFFSDTFELSEMEVNFIRRGLRYPQLNIA